MPAMMQGSLQQAGWHKADTSSWVLIVMIVSQHGSAHGVMHMCRCPGLDRAKPACQAQVQSLSGCPCCTRQVHHVSGRRVGPGDAPTQ